MILYTGKPRERVKTLNNIFEAQAIQIATDELNLALDMMALIKANRMHSQCTEPQYWCLDVRE